MPENQDFQQEQGVVQEQSFAQNQAPGQAPDGKVPGKSAATASLVLGIIGVAFCVFGYSAVVSVILGIIGLVLAGNAKKAGFAGGIRTAGAVLSVISLVCGAVVFVVCIACVGTLSLFA